MPQRCVILHAQVPFEPQNRRHGWTDNPSVRPVQQVSRWQTVWETLTVIKKAKMAAGGHQQRDQLSNTSGRRLATQAMGEPRHETVEIFGK
ncbi:MAG: hypothetical protein AB8B71_12000 [Paracoccaceae bacterium]